MEPVFDVRRTSRDNPNRPGAPFVVPFVAMPGAPSSDALAPRFWGIWKLRDDHHL